MITGTSARPVFLMVYFVQNNLQYFNLEYYLFHHLLQIVCALLPARILTLKVFIVQKSYCHTSIAHFKRQRCQEFVCQHSLCRFHGTGPLIYDASVVFPILCYFLLTIIPLPTQVAPEYFIPLLFETCLASGCEDLMPFESINRVSSIFPLVFIDIKTLSCRSRVRSSDNCSLYYCRALRAL